MPMLRPILLMCALGLPACGAGSEAGKAAPQSAGDASRQEREELFRLGQRAAARGDSVRAEQYLSLAIERGYPKARVLPVLLQVCLGGSRLRAALDHAQPYLDQHPNQDALRFLVANIHLGLGQNNQARAELDTLLRRSPRFEEALFLRAVLGMSSDTEAARTDLRSYLEVTPHGLHAAEARSRLSELAIREPARETALRTNLLRGTR
jgi:tetratricopeptide (TPR) repeat protein